MDSSNILLQLIRTQREATMRGQPLEAKPALRNILTLATTADIRRAARDVDPNPSPAQREQGNYSKGHISWKGLPIAIEVAKGGYRRGISKDGTEWVCPMPRAHYGYIKRTESAADGDAVDVFLCDGTGPGEHLDSDVVFVVNQIKPNGDFDEHKVVLGCASKDAAKEVYLSAYKPGWKCGPITAMTVPQFKEWLKNGDTGRPVMTLATAQPDQPQDQTQDKPHSHGDHTTILLAYLDALIDAEAGIDPHADEVADELHGMLSPAEAAQADQMAATLATEWYTLDTSEGRFPPEHFSPQSDTGKFWNDQAQSRGINQRGLHALARQIHEDRGIHPKDAYREAAAELEPETPTGLTAKKTTPQPEQQHLPQTQAPPTPNTPNLDKKPALDNRPEQQPTTPQKQPAVPTAGKAPPPPMPAGQTGQSSEQAAQNIQGPAQATPAQKPPQPQASPAAGQAGPQNPNVVQYQPGMQPPPKVAQYQPGMQPPTAGQPVAQAAAPSPTGQQGGGAAPWRRLAPGERSPISGRIIKSQNAWFDPARGQLVYADPSAVLRKAQQKEQQAQATTTGQAQPQQQPQQPPDEHHQRAVALTNKIVAHVDNPKMQPPTQADYHELVSLAPRLNQPLRVNIRNQILSSFGENAAHKEMLANALREHVRQQIAKMGDQSHDPIVAARGSALGKDELHIQRASGKASNTWEKLNGPSEDAVVHAAKRVTEAQTPEERESALNDLQHIHKAHADAKSELQRLNEGRQHQDELRQQAEAHNQRPMRSPEVNQDRFAGLNDAAVQQIANSSEKDVGIDLIREAKKELDRRSARRAVGDQINQDSKHEMLLPKAPPPPMPAGQTGQSSEQAAEGIQGPAQPQKSLSESGQKLVDHISKFIDSSSSPHDRKATYADSVRSVVSRMPQAAHERLLQTVKGITFHPDINAIGKAAYDDAMKSPYPTIDTQRNAFVGTNPDSLKAGGAYIIHNGHLHIDGDFNQEQSASDKYGTLVKAHEIYAHEFGHAIDGPSKAISSSPNWKEAWNAEISGNWLSNEKAKLSRYAATSPEEGLAEFLRVLYASDISTDKIRHDFPKASSIIDSHGLWPEDRNGSNESAKEIFEKRIKLPDDRSHIDTLIEKNAERENQQNDAISSVLDKFNIKTENDLYDVGVSNLFGKHLSSEQRSLFGGDPGRFLNAVKSHLANKPEEPGHMGIPGLEPPMRREYKDADRLAEMSRQDKRVKQMTKAFGGDPVAVHREAVRLSQQDKHLSPKDAYEKALAEHLRQVTSGEYNPQTKAGMPPAKPSKDLIAAPEHRPETSNGEHLQGKETKIRAVGFKPIPARYEVRELASLHSSHRYDTGIPLPDHNYPDKLQPRNYTLHSQEDAKVRKFIDPTERDAGYFLSNDPTAANGPPTVSDDGVIINGNGRAMALQLAAHQKDYDWYRDALIDEAQRYGIDPAKVRGMKHPVLVRSVGMKSTDPETLQFARAGNVANTESQSPVRTAASHGGLIKSSVFDSLNLEGDETFSEAVTNAKDPNAKAFRENLRNALPSQEVSRYFTPGGELTQAGVEFVRSMMLTKVLPVDLVEHLGEDQKGLKRAIEGSLPQLVKLESDPSDKFKTMGKRISSGLEEALQFMRRAKDRGKPVKNDNDVNHLLSQQKLDGTPFEKLSPSGRMMIDFINSSGDKPTVFRNKLTELIGRVRDASGMFGDESADMAQEAAEALGIPKRDGAFTDDARPADEMVDKHLAGLPDDPEAASAKLDELAGKMGVPVDAFAEKAHNHADAVHAIRQQEETSAQHQFHQALTDAKRDNQAQPHIDEAVRAGQEDASREAQAREVAARRADASKGDGAPQQQGVAGSARDPNAKPGEQTQPAAEKPTPSTTAEVQAITPAKVPVDQLVAQREAEFKANHLEIPNGSPSRQFLDQFMAENPNATPAQIHHAAANHYYYDDAAQQHYDSAADFQKAVAKERTPERRARLTGDTPASQTATSDIPHSPHHATVDAWLSHDWNKHVSPEAKQRIGRALKTTISRMHPGAADIAMANMGEPAQFYDSVQHLTNEYNAESRRLGEPEEDGQVAGYYALHEDGRGALHVDYSRSGDESDAVWTHAHEIHHAIDGKDRYSGLPEWQQAWQREIYRHKDIPEDQHPLTKYASSHPNEGFAEFGALLTADKDYARDMFPKSYAFFEKHGLI